MVPNGDGAEGTSPRAGLKLIYKYLLLQKKKKKKEMQGMTGHKVEVIGGHSGSDKGGMRMGRTGQGGGWKRFTVAGRIGN